MSTKVVHCKKEKYDIYIGRPSKWGNPYSEKEGTLAKWKVPTREEAVRKYSQWLSSQTNLLKDINELKDKILGCWCYPKQCHGDILAYYADTGEIMDLIIRSNDPAWSILFDGRK